MVRGGGEQENNKDEDKPKPRIPGEKYIIVTPGTPDGPGAFKTNKGSMVWRDPKTGNIMIKGPPGVKLTDKDIEAAISEYKQQPKQTATDNIGNLPTAANTGNPPLIQLDTGNRISIDDIHICFFCASGNNIDNQRGDKLAMQTAQLTGVSAESAKLSLSDTYLRTLNKAGPAQASQALASFEAEAAADPTTLNKVGDLAKLYDSGYDAVAYQASDSIADKLSAGANPRTALEETSVPKAVSLKADEVVKSVEDSQLAGAEQQLSSSSLSGPQLTTKDTNLAESPEQDPDLFQISSPTEQELPEQTNDGGDDGLSASSSSVAGGTTEGGGGALDGGTTTEGVADEDEDGGDDDTSIAEFSGGEDDDSSDGGDSDDSGDGGSGGDGGDEG